MGKKTKNTQTSSQNKIIKRSIWIVVIALALYGVFYFAQITGPQGEDFSISYEIQGREHIADGSSHPEYNSNPPSSGWHYESPAEGGFYSEALVDETVIHNLEHGDIWIAYQEDINEEVVEILKSFAGPYIVVSPREANTHDIALVAWGRVDAFDLDETGTLEQRISDFIKRYDNRGPEKVRAVQAGHI